MPLYEGSEEKTICLSAVLSMLLTIFSLCFPKLCSLEITSAYQRVISSLLPSLFISSVLSSLINKTKLRDALKRIFCPPLCKLLKTSDEQSLAFLFSVFFGYPIGVTVLEDQYQSNLISQRQYKRSLLFSNNCGAAFIFSYLSLFPAVGRIGAVIIFISQLFSAFVIARLSFRAEDTAFAPRKVSYCEPSLAQALCGSVKNSCKNLCYMGGFVILFSCLSKAVIFFFPFLPAKGVYFIGEISGFFQSFSPDLPLCAAASGFGGLSVYLQSLALSPTLSKTPSYVLYKLLNSFLMAVFSLLAILIL